MLFRSRYRTLCSPLGPSHPEPSPASPLVNIWNNSNSRPAARTARWRLPLRCVHSVSRLKYEPIPQSKKARARTNSAQPGSLSLERCPMHHQTPGWRRLVLRPKAESQRAQLAGQIYPTGQSRRLASSCGPRPACLSILSLLFLYYSSIIPLFFLYSWRLFPLQPAGGCRSLCVDQAAFRAAVSPAAQFC